MFSFGRRLRMLAADDQHVEAGRMGEGQHFAAAGRGGRRRAGIEARAQVLQIVADVGRRLHDGVGREVVRFRQGPERGRTGAGAAEGEHGPLHLAERGLEGCHRLVGHLARDHGDVTILKAKAPGRRFQIGRGRLAGTFVVGPIVDDRPITQGGQAADVARVDLRRHRQEGREFLQTVHLGVPRLLVANLGISGRRGRNQVRLSERDRPGAFRPVGRGLAPPVGGTGR